MSQGPVILALDQSSTRTGFAKGRSDGPVALRSYANPKCGSDYGRALTSYRDWLRTQIGDVDMVAFEQPIVPTVLQLHAARLLYGIAGVIEMVCQERGIPAFEANTNEMKKLLYGKGGKKPDFAVAKAKANAWGFDPSNIDECDAAGVFLITVQHSCPDAFRDVWWAKRKES